MENPVEKFFMALADQFGIRIDHKWKSELVNKMGNLVNINSSNSINNWIKRGYLPKHRIQNLMLMDIPDDLKKLLNLCEKNSNASQSSSFLTDKAEYPCNPDVGSGKVVELDHADLIKRFRNQEKAKKVNFQLLEIERYDPGKWDVIETYLQGVLDGVKPKIRDNKKTVNSS